MPSPHRWVVFVHQLPAHPSNGRVKIWRRLQQVGAVAVKNAVHLLPNNPQSREDFEWLRTEVAALGGEANVFEASSISGIAERQILARFRKVKSEGSRKRKDIKSMRTANPPKEEETPHLDTRDYQHRTWVTRPRPGVDRFSSAWLIRRFIDPRARFAFTGDARRPGRHQIPFDTYGAELGHQQRLCTFEVLARRFGVDDQAVHALGRTVHAIDLGEAAPDAAEAAMVERLVAGLRATHAADPALLDAGIALFETLYASARDTDRGGRSPSKPAARPAKRRRKGSRQPARRPRK